MEKQTKMKVIILNTIFVKILINKEGNFFFLKGIFKINGRQMVYHVDNVAYSHSSAIFYT